MDLEQCAQEAAAAAAELKAPVREATYRIETAACSYAWLAEQQRALRELATYVGASAQSVAQRMEGAGAIREHADRAHEHFSRARKIARY